MYFRYQILGNLIVFSHKMLCETVFMKPTVQKIYLVKLEEIYV